MRWELRRSFWNGYQRVIFRAAKPLEVPAPSPSAPPVKAVPFTTAYPKTPIEGIVVAHHAPKDEFRRKVLVAKKLQLQLD